MLRSVLGNVLGKVLGRRVVVLMVVVVAEEARVGWGGCCLERELMWVKD